MAPSFYRFPVVVLAAFFGGALSAASQGTWETSQPTAPTACDIFWAGVWSPSTKT
jgi:hypothetical protein